MIIHEGQQEWAFGETDHFKMWYRRIIKALSDLEGFEDTPGTRLIVSYVTAEEL